MVDRSFLPMAHVSTTENLVLGLDLALQSDWTRKIVSYSRSEVDL